MKTPEEITRWCDMMLKLHPNIEDTNFFNSIKDYMKEQRPQGEWKETGYETGALGITYRQTQCSNCGWEHALPMWWNFCPNCGADMRSENKFNDLVVFDDQPKRQLENPDCHNEL